jgi:hypothetical protein
MKIGLQYFKYLLLFFTLAMHPLHSQESLDVVTTVDLNLAPRPEQGATPSDQVPVIDGEVINDEMWNSIEPFGNLVQTRPHAGQPASENTEIRIAYNATTFYLSVICFDSRPEELVVSDARRDANLDNTDAFLFILDTYHDKQNGFIFGTNAIGIEYDAQVDNEGQGNFNANRQQGGTIGGFNINWDASWTVKTQVGDFGWSAEFAIPFNTLRFNSGESQTWGANFQRIIRKTNEVAYWSPMPIQFDLKRLSLAGTLSNLNLKSPGNLKVVPYVLGEVSEDRSVEPNDPETNTDFGFDIKYSITPSMTLDLTYNTDFAQVEVDEIQVNLDRFNLFFPEKRPFFLENAGLFTVGSPGEVDLFFSRRIGIGDAGQVVPIIAGMRLSGRINRTNVGLLNMFTDEVPEESIQTNNYTVMRVDHQVGPRSSIGGAYVARLGVDDLANDYNRVFALDGKWGIGNKAQISGFYSQSRTPGINDNQHAFQLQTAYEWDGLNISGAYTEVGEEFNPEVGFLLREDFRKAEFRILKQVRPKREMIGLMELRPHVSYRGYWNFSGFYETGFLHIDNHWEWRSGLEIHTGINLTTEGVVEDFEISEDVWVRADTYKHAEAQLVFMTNPSKPVYISIRSIMGGSFGGERYLHSGTLGFRVGDKFNSEFGFSYNDFRLPEGDFVKTIFRGRLSYSFTPRIYLQSLIQYSNISETLFSNIRFGWLQRANTGLFLVYNEGRADYGLENRTFTIKYSRMFDVIK